MYFKFSSSRAKYVLGVHVVNMATDQPLLTIEKLQKVHITLVKKSSHCLKNCRKYCVNKVWHR